MATISNHQPGKRACDQCHKRKVKCSASQPCRNCSSASLSCTYNAIPQKKGPKGTRAKVISELRDGQRRTEIGIPEPPKDNSHFDFNSPPTSPMFLKSAVLTQQLINDSIDVFFTSMYPTMPIIHRGQLLDRLRAEFHYSIETYCLIGSLCAFMMVQTGMKEPGIFAMDSKAVKSRCLAATVLLHDILRSRKDYDYTDSPSLDAVRTSFFLYATYFNLDKHATAWFHLREATTLAHIMGMQEEQTYQSHDALNNIYRRRFYWLLFVTERAYALERHRPLTLHATIELPTLDEVPSEALTISGFLHLINLFRALDDTFIGLWNKARSDCSTAWLAQLQQQLSDALPPNLNSPESQVADIRISRQWLRTMVWQLSITNGYLSSSSPDSSMTFKYPIEIARDLAKDISILSLQSMEVHGIGLVQWDASVGFEMTNRDLQIEKLFDVACTLTDVIACVPLDKDDFDVVPSEYLTQLLNLISQLRGGGSRFLPLLLGKVSENLPFMAAPLIHAPFPLNDNDNAASPADSTQSAPLLPLGPITPLPALTPSFSDPNPSGMSPTVSDPMSSWPTPKVVAPIPRSVPRIPFNGNFS